MLESLKRIFEKRTGAEAFSQRTGDETLVAICALFVEMARIDEAFTPNEMETILETLIDHYGLSRDQAKDIVAEADRALADSVDLWQFARLINEHYNVADKLIIVDALWRLVYLDGSMDAHEHYLMSKLKNLLRLDHQQLIASKLRAKAAVGTDSTGKLIEKGDGDD